MAKTILHKAGTRGHADPGWLNTSLSGTVQDAFRFNVGQSATWQSPINVITGNDLA